MIKNKKKVDENLVNHDYNCDFCDNPAIYNIQQVWKKYYINNDGSFDEEDCWEGNGDNTYYCEDCYDEHN